MKIKTSNIFFTTFCFISFVVYFFCFIIDPLRFWVEAYLSSLFIIIVYLYIRRENYFTVSYLVIALNLIGITIPLIPYFYFYSGDINNYLLKSIYLHSWGIILFIGCLLTFTPSFEDIKLEHKDFQIEAWDYFFRINKYVFYLTMPLVFILLLISGAWKVYINEQTSFSRISDLKGLGPLLLFSFINVLSSSLYIVQLFNCERKIKGILLFILTITINNVGYGRGPLILMLCIFLFFYGITNKFSFKVIIGIIFAGGLLVSAQLLRALGRASELQNQILGTSLKFSGDFPEVVNTAALMEYLHNRDYFGGSILWGNLWYYIPRALYGAKPQVFGGLELNVAVFPDLYLGKSGGSTTTFGIYGTLFSICGIGGLLVFIIILAYLIGVVENNVLKWIKKPQPNFFFIFSLTTLSYVQIIHREAFLGLFNSFNQAIFYFIFYLFTKQVLIKGNSRKNQLKQG